METVCFVRRYCKAKQVQPVLGLPGYLGEEPAFVHWVRKRCL